MKIKFEINQKDKQKIEEKLKKKNFRAEWEDNYLIVSAKYEDGILDDNDITFIMTKILKVKIPK